MMKRTTTISILLLLLPSLALAWNPSGAWDSTTATFLGVPVNLLPANDDTHDIGSASLEWRDLYVDGTANIDALVADTVTISGGDIDGTTIGALSPAPGIFDTLTVTPNGLTATLSVETRILKTDTNNLSHFVTSGNALTLEPFEIVATTRTIETNATTCEDDGGALRVVTVANHQLVVGDRVSFANGSGTVCANITASVEYFVQAVDSVTKFNISLTQGGAAVAYSAPAAGPFNSYEEDTQLVVSPSAFSGLDYDSPTLAFGDKDTGFIEYMDDGMMYITAGTSRATMTATAFDYTGRVYAAGNTVIAGTYVQALSVLIHGGSFLPSASRSFIGVNGVLYEGPYASAGGDADQFVLDWKTDFDAHDISNAAQGDVTLKFTVPGSGTYKIPAVNQLCKTIQGVSAMFGPTAPVTIYNGSFGGPGFDADAETVYIDWEIPGDYDGTSSMSFKIYWFPQTGDAMTDGEKVKWDVNYRVVDWDTDDTDSGTADEVTETYTQSGSGDENDTHETLLTVPQDNTNQDLVAGEVAGFILNRDVTGEAGNSYSGDAGVARFEICYTSTGALDHF